MFLSLTFIGHVIVPFNLIFPSSLLCLVCLSNRVVATLRIVCPVRVKGKKDICSRWRN